MNRTISVINNSEVQVGDWHIELSDDGRQLWTRFKRKPGDICIKQDDDGFVVDIYGETGSSFSASMYALYEELEELEDDES